ncbi:hypothetical protein Daus18300_010068 [Diaporthe australafricana]|uniref:Uncharacterized protein n=1 Tax=Diaporthe australafricana TaxID=127596 RepID=A0ABR3WC21_9PEZI
MSSVTSTVMVIGGTPTIFLPLPTPYPSGDGCGTNIYQLTATAPTFLAWDPVYGQSVTDATSCFPPQVTTWWLQASTALIYTALGPTFACPEAYSTVSTTLVESSVQEVYCCPSQFTLLSAQPDKGGSFPSQCTSALTEGQTLSWFTGVESGSSLSTTTVFTSPATMFGVPVNGFNVGDDRIIININIIVVVFAICLILCRAIDLGNRTRCGSGYIFCAAVVRGRGIHSVEKTNGEARAVEPKS